MSVQETGPAEHVLESVAATLSHIQLIREKRDRLEAAQLEAEEQFAHRVGVGLRDGTLEPESAAEMYYIYREAALPGFSKRWNAVVPLHSTTIHRDAKYGRRYRPNGPNGSWMGIAPLPTRDACPPPGQSVVYVLYDGRNTPCYVGSSQVFRDRLKWHIRDGKPVAHWTAYPCVDRDAAYALETKVLREHKPYINKRASR